MNKNNTKYFLIPILLLLVGGAAYYFYSGKDNMILPPAPPTSAPSKDQLSLIQIMKDNPEALANIRTTEAVDNWRFAKDEVSLQFRHVRSFTPLEDKKYKSYYEFAYPGKALKPRSDFPFQSCDCRGKSLLRLDSFVDLKTYEDWTYNITVGENGSGKLIITIPEQAIAVEDIYLVPPTWTCKEDSISIDEDEAMDDLKTAEPTLKGEFINLVRAQKMNDGKKIVKKNSQRFLKIHEEIEKQKALKENKTWHDGKIEVIVKFNGENILQ